MLTSDVRDVRRQKERTIDAEMGPNRDADGAAGRRAESRCRLREPAWWLFDGLNIVLRAICLNMRNVRFRCAADNCCYSCWMDRTRTPHRARKQLGHVRPLSLSNHPLALNINPPRPIHWPIYTRSLTPPHANIERSTHARWTCNRRNSCRVNGSELDQARVVGYLQNKDQSVTSQRCDFLKINPVVSGISLHPCNSWSGNCDVRYGQFKCAFGVWIYQDLNHVAYMA